MNLFHNASLLRKVCYLAAIALLLLPIAYLSQPATVVGGSGGTMSAGGKLAKLRVKYNLSQAELGEIDPASETMKLATVGLRGIAVNALWSSAIHYQKVKDFNTLELTVKQIIRLQPNFLKVWDFQAHNLSYNTSVEFDNYRDRYQWVKKGIAFLILGTQYNRDEPGLLNSVGWFVGQKMGRSDENRQFRRLFKEDRDFHAEFRKHNVDVDKASIFGKPDSWLVSRLWYLRGEEAVARGKPLRLKSPVLFYNSAPMAYINHATALEKDDGIFGQQARIAWQRAEDSWTRYGSREILASAGFMIRLNSSTELMQRMQALNDELDRVVPGARAQLRQQKLALLEPEERVLLDKPATERTYEESMAAYQIGMRIHVSNEELVARASKEQRTAARDLADRISHLAEIGQTTASYRNIVNYEYWQNRCAAEQLDIALDARRLVREADQIHRSGGELSRARRMYEEAWVNWAELFKKYPVLMDTVEGDELVESVVHYRDLLLSLDEDFPADFPLNTLLDTSSKGRGLKEEIHTIQGTPEPAKTEPESPATKEPAADVSDNPAATPDDSGKQKEPAEKTNPAGEKEPAAESKSDSPPSQPVKAKQPNPPAANPAPEGQADGNSD